MSPELALVLGCLGTGGLGGGFVGGILGHALGRRSLSVDLLRHPIHLRAATHEAGHALVARAVPHLEALRVQIDSDVGEGKGGQVMARCPVQRGPAEYWGEVAYALGGIAGELVESRRVRTGNCLGDLDTAREAAAQVVTRGGGLTPPWTMTSQGSGSFDPVRAFRAVPAEEAVILRIAYAHARAVLLADRDRFTRLVKALLEHGVVHSFDPIIAR
jgi:ATP-dependent Zn protease